MALCNRSVPVGISAVIHPERVQQLNSKKKVLGKYVLYWMQASQRALCNHALEYAIRQANELNQPVVVLFGITSNYPEANARHYAFMLQGLQNVHDGLKKRGIIFVVRLQSPERAAASMAKSASLVVTDRGYLGIQKAWRAHVAEKAPCLVVQVESDVVVPVAVTSEKEAYSAGILRPKLQKHLKRFLVPLKKTPVKRRSLELSFEGIDITNTASVLKQLSIDGSVTPTKSFKGGTAIAEKLLDDFVSHKLKDYADLRSDPSLDLGSHMSPYLHFGQISSLYIALKVQQSRGKPLQAKVAFLEELIVRRELSMNFVHYNAHYDSIKCLPGWAEKTLADHKKDRREYTYTLVQLEQARTHDPYWNAAQKEMVLTGKMHNYMRMYWGKKILEWSKTPKRAYETALYLNNKYELDGRDPNGFAGVAWCFGKHDRAWKERPVFGKVRYMNAAGLKRKFNIDAYVQRINKLS
jgi:deoxyribodipyrimidine photo-lyase